VAPKNQGFRLPGGVTSGRVLQSKPLGKIILASSGLFETEQAKADVPIVAFDR